MEKDPDIFQYKARRVCASGRAAQKKACPPAEGGKGSQKGRDPVCLFLKDRTVLFFDFLRALQKAQDIVEHLKIRCYLCLFFKIGHQVEGQDCKEEDDADPCVQKHQSKCRKRSSNRQIVRQIAPLAQGRCGIDVVIEGIPACVAQPRQDLLQAEPFLFVRSLPEPVVLLPGKRKVPCPQSRRPKQIIQIFLACRTAGAVHLRKHLVQIQIIPGDVINLKVPGMMQIILRDLRITFRSRLLEGRLPETAAQSCSELVPGPFSFPQAEHQCDQYKSCQNPEESQDRLVISHQLQVSKCCSILHRAMPVTSVADS